MFHIVARGGCWVWVSGGDRHWACEGDVIVLPYGDRHTLGGVTPAEPVSISSVVSAPPWDAMQFLRHGGGGACTEVFCGYLHSTDPLFDPKLGAFPPVFVVRPPAGASAGWVRASVSYAMEQAGAGLGPIGTRLPELVVIEVLKLHLATAPAADRGWLAALRDPVLAPVLALLHGSPARRWTVATLASGAAVSRSLLDERFRHVLGRSPIRYLTEWRMHLADELLATTELGVATVARRVGYGSEEAFSRAFKRARGMAPGRWRAARGTTVEQTDRVTEPLSTQ